MFILNVNYEDKDKVKQKGAYWNSKIKKWYIPKRNLYGKFKEEIEKTVGLNNPTIITDHFYLIIAQHKCWKCKKEIEVIGAAYDSSYDYHEDKNDYIFDNESFIYGFISDLNITEDFIKYLEEKFNFKIGYSKTMGGKYPANHCIHCGAIQGNNFVFAEANAPIFPLYEEQLKEIILLKIPLKFDTVSYFQFNGIGDKQFILNHCKIEKMNDLGFEIIDYTY